MLTPDEILTVPDYFVKLYHDLEMFVIRDFSESVANAGRITDDAMWQRQRAIDIGMSMNAIDTMVETTMFMSLEETEKIFKELAEMSLKNDIPLYKLKEKMVPNIDKSPFLRMYLEAAIDQTAGELFNITRSMGFAYSTAGQVEYLPMYQYYTKALDLAQMQVSSGILDYQTATRNAVKELAQSGVRWINFESGIHNRAEVAVRRAILTGVNQMSSQFNNQVIKDLGAEYVEVTAHMGARPSHASWQGKIYKVNGSDSNYANLAEATGLGTGDGLCGWNCRHNYYAFFPEISKPSFTQLELDTIDPLPVYYDGKLFTFYEATQKQRQIENAIRESKMEIIGYKALNDDEIVKITEIRLQQQIELYEDFAEQTGIKKYHQKHEVVGYDDKIMI